MKKLTENKNIFDTLNDKNNSLNLISGISYKDILTNANAIIKNILENTDDNIIIFDTTSDFKNIEKEFNGKVYDVNLMRNYYITERLTIFNLSKLDFQSQYFYTTKILKNLNNSKKTWIVTNKVDYLLRPKTDFINYCKNFKENNIKLIALTNNTDIFFSNNEALEFFNNSTFISLKQSKYITDLLKEKYNIELKDTIEIFN